VLVLVLAHLDLGYDMPTLTWLIDNQAWNALYFIIAIGVCLFVYHYRIMNPTIISVNQLRKGVKSLLEEIKELTEDHDNSKQRIATIEGRITKR